MTANNNQEQREEAGVLSGTSGRKQPVDSGQLNISFLIQS